MHAGEKATEADGMQPIGMHSCFILVVKEKISSLCFGQKILFELEKEKSNTYYLRTSQN